MQDPLASNTPSYSTDPGLLDDQHAVPDTLTAPLPVDPTTAYPMQGKFYPTAAEDILSNKIPDGVNFAKEKFWIILYDLSLIFFLSIVMSNYKYSLC